MSGFSDWVEKVAESNTALSYREKVSLSETASMLQSLAFGPNYKAAYCLAVCPAGEDVIGPFLTNKASFLKDTLRPLTEKKKPSTSSPAPMRRSTPHGDSRIKG